MFGFLKLISEFSYTIKKFSESIDFTGILEYIIVLIFKSIKLHHTY